LSRRGKIVAATAGTVLLFGLAFFYGLFRYSVEHMFDGSFTRGSETIRTDLGDRFSIEYRTSAFPRVTTGMTLRDSEGRKVYYLATRGEFQKQNPTTILDDSPYRCYYAYGLLIYGDGSRWEAVRADEVGRIDPRDAPMFEHVARSLVSTGEWGWIKKCAAFLLRSGDEGIKAILQRYSSGQFSNAEIELNKNSGMDSDEMRAFAKGLLGQR
jgi:hypothetical protein